MKRRKDDLYAQDRESMKGKAYLGLGQCFSVHDIAITQSQGTIHQQSNEHLSSSDIAIARARRMLDAAADAVAGGGDPPGVVREAADNDFRDMVVVTGVLGGGQAKEAFCGVYAGDGEFFRPRDGSRD